MRSSNSSSTSIHELRGGLPIDDVPAVLEYLQSGTTVFDMMSYEPDVLEKSIFIVGGGSLMSDGFWIWRKDLSHYVEKYGISLNKSFVESIKNGNFNKASDSDIIEKYREILRCYEEYSAEFRS